METEIRLTKGIYIAAYVLLGYGIAVLGPPAWVLTAVVLTGGDGLSELQALAPFGAFWGPVICGFVAIGGGYLLKRWADHRRYWQGYWLEQR